ncbi:MAG: biotin--[acetyl-CoA-carboxylase] ligase [Thermoleophilaceae bacterium]|nr:biotin--[acetyl-CoA-carboxylase] ligase [Thermoleophilaceae bacterium]
MTGRPRVHHRVTDSTNERAKELACKGAPHGTLVTADEQSAGRGRQGREWTAPAGTAVLMSVVLRDLGEAQELVPMAAAVAVCEAAEALAPVQCRVKWPNDVWVDGRKLAGILIEGRPQEGWAVLGIGLNVTTTQFPSELANIATSLAIAAPARPTTPSQVLEGLVSTLESRLGDAPARILSAWRERDALRGSVVRWSDGEGTAAGIDDNGSLLVETESGTRALHAGEVHLLR